jgi:hypothetical protein
MNWVNSAAIGTMVPMLDLVVLIGTTILGITTTISGCVAVVTY